MTSRKLLIGKATGVIDGWWGHLSIDPVVFPSPACSSSPMVYDNFELNEIRFFYYDWYLMRYCFEGQWLFRRHDVHGFQEMRLANLNLHLAEKSNILWLILVRSKLFADGECVLLYLRPLDGTGAACIFHICRSCNSHRTVFLFLKCCRESCETLEVSG